jgi:shikimate kinase
LALIGLSGAGKTTVAPLVASRIGFEWLDLDSAIERRAGDAVADLIRGEGEAAFRAREAESLRAALEDPAPAGGEGSSGLVIACGGGALGTPESRARLRADAFTVWLRVSPERAAARLGRAERAARPLLGPGGPRSEAGWGEAGWGAEARLTALLTERRSLYEAAADAAVDTDGRTPDQVADAVEALWRARQGSGGEGQAPPGGSRGAGTPQARWD